MNKRRHAEMDNMHAQLAGAQSRATAAEAEAQKRVEAADAVVAELGERNGWVCGWRNLEQHTLKLCSSCCFCVAFWHHHNRSCFASFMCVY